MNGVFKILGSFIEILVEGVFYLLKQVGLVGIFMFKKPPPPDPAYDAKFAQDTPNVGSYNKGFSVSGTQYLTKEASTRSMLVASPSGGGKSQVVILPSIMNVAKEGHALAIHDCSGELYQQTSAYLKQLGYTLHCINFTDPETSDGYNPLLRTKSASDITKLATKLVQASLGQEPKDPFWSLQAASVISFYIHMLKYQPVHMQHLANVRQLIILSTAGAKSKETAFVDRLVVRTKDDALLAEYKSILAMPDNTRNSVFATCKAALQPFADENVCLTTSIDTIDFEDIRTRTAIFIQNPSLDAKYYQPLISIFFEQLFNHCLQKLPAKDAPCVFFIIDELTSLQLPSLGRFLEVGRKYACGCVLAVQDVQQLSNVYKGEADTILANCSTQLYISPSDATCEALEKRLGSVEHIHEGKSRVRPLLTRSQIKGLGSDQGLLFQPNVAPMLLQLTPAYKSKLANTIKLQPIERARQLPDDLLLVSPSYISLAV